MIFVWGLVPITQDEFINKVGLFESLILCTVDFFYVFVSTLQRLFPPSFEASRDVRD